MDSIGGYEMRRLKKRFITAIIAAVLAAGAAGTGVCGGKKGRTAYPITSVSISVRSNVEAETDYDEATVMVTADSDRFTVGAYKWATEKDYWKIGDVPKVKVELHARTGYYFKITGASKYQINGAEYGSAKRRTIMKRLN